MTSRQVQAQEALSRALQQAYPEEYRYDEPYLPKIVMEQGLSLILTGTWSGKIVRATVTELYDNEFAVTIMVGEACKRETVNLNPAEEPLAVP